MANAAALALAAPGDVLLVIHDFTARSPDELSLKRGEKIELIEKDDDFGDGWFLGRHLAKEDNGLFPAVYTTLATKPAGAANAARRIVSPQAISTQPAELMGDEHMRAPSVQPPASSSQPHAERSFSAPLIAPQTPPNVGNNARPAANMVAQRSISMTNGTHQNSPVMNETLSVIEEHITDLSTPRTSLMTPNRSITHEEQAEDLQRRLSYIHGHETDEEESAALTAEEVSQWDPNRVAEYLEDIGVDQKHCQVFREQEITGEVLLGMDQGSLMLKEFELGSIGKRLALWQKVKAIQEEVKSGVRRSSGQSYLRSPSAARDRSTSVGLPRIPSLMEGGRVPSRQNSLQRSPTKTHSRYDGSTASMPATSDIHGGHTPRPSAASVRDIAQSHSRRHSSIGEALASPTSKAPAESPIMHKHAKQGSFDQSWTMVDAPSKSSTAGTPKDSSFQNIENSELPTPGDHGMLVVSSLDLDRGYFSGPDGESKSNKLRKKQGADLHGRAPSDSFGTKRLSAVFRSKRAGSTDSLNIMNEPSATQLFYGKSGQAGRSPGAPPKNGHRKAASTVSPVVTKLEYGDSPSIDAVTVSPQFAGSETSSMEHKPAHKSMFSRDRATGLKAISDAITGGDKRGKNSPKPAPSEKGSFAKESPLQSPGSSSPSLNSKSFEANTDEASLLKQSTSSGRGTPILPKRRGKKSTSAYTRGLEKKTPKEMIAGCDYSGWMKKKSSHLMTTWKTRLFVLRGTRLSYFYTEDDTEEKGLIDISFHRVLPANNDRILGLHATFTGAGASPTSPQNAQLETAAAEDAKKNPLMKGDDSGMFIFKLVPPRAGLSKAVNFTKPTVHYFAVDNIQQGRLWMAALMKATIERDDAHQVITTYKEKTISLAKAKAMRQRPPALMGSDDEKKEKKKKEERDVEKEMVKEEMDEKEGLRISYVGDGASETATVTTNGDKGSFTTGGATDSNANDSIEDLPKSPPVGT